MKLTPTLGALLILLLQPPARSAAPSAVAEDEKIWEHLIQNRGRFVRVTPRPYHVAWAGAALCFRPSRIPHSPHGEHWIHVSITPSAAPVLRSGRGTYPVGTLILKQKFRDPAGTQTEFYTGMRKRERGYNPDLGDWEFFLLDAGGQHVTARGRIESCMECHEKYRATDFVSRRYLTTPEEIAR